MTTPFDWLHESLRQAGLGTLSANNAFSPDMIARSAAAFAPVFTLALQRLATNPDALKSFSDPANLARFSRYIQDPASAFTAGGFRDGESLFPMLFGSNASANTMADWVARMCGFEPDPVRRLQSGFTTMVAAHLAKVLDMPERDAGNLDKLASRVLEFGQLKMPEGLPSYNPFAEAMSSFMEGFLGTKDNGKSAKEGKGDPQDPLSEMMKAGGALQESYFRELNAMFDRATGS
ncbi:hypothetical protein [Coralliovum pocilloporae]|uniref:hypothetical protein n=1 Tax=Coralliovum pocilloporae TaxID=3066369 RepID=UPI003307A679